jgi:hypothetical protein
VHESGIETKPEPHVQHFSAKEIRKWPLKKIAAALLAALVVFAGGVAVGKGELHAKTTDSNGKNLPAQLDYSSVNEVYKLL